MKFKINKVTECSDLISMGNVLTGEIIKKGNELVSSEVTSNFVLNFIDLERPEAFRNVNHNQAGTSYWMTARGVDKSNLKGPGKDILLVKGYDKGTGEMLISVPEEYDPRIRVSVDAIEHYMIYREFPGTGAIVHVHAWIDDVLCTSQSYPCGTSELAENVVELLKKTSSPERTEVGLKNHGLTITGPDIKDTFSRIRGRLKIKVPMMN